MDLIDLVSERVKILHEGEWKKDQIEVKESSKYGSFITEEMKKVARERFVARKEKNPKLFDGNALHLSLESSIIQPNRIFLAVASVKYSLYDIAREEYVKEYGWRELPTGIGICAAVLTSDSKIVMHHRFSHVDHLGKIAVIGGILQENNPFNETVNELEEELGLLKNEIKRIRLIGISNRLDERINYELSFLVKISLSSSQIIEREKTLKNKEGEIFFINCLAEEVKQYLINNHKQFSSTHFATLVMAGRCLWKHNWSQMNQE